MKKVLLIIAGIVALILVGTQLTPSHWKVTRSNFIKANPKAIYPLVADWKNWEKWSAFKVPGMELSYSGKPSGVGAIFIGKSKDMEVTNEIVKADSATGIVYECRMPGWKPCIATIAFSPEGTGTKVDYTYEGEQTRNPIHRIMGLFVGKMLGKPLEEGLANLKTVVETKASKK